MLLLATNNTLLSRKEPERFVSTAHAKVIADKTVTRSHYRRKEGRKVRKKDRKTDYFTLREKREKGKVRRRNSRLTPRRTPESSQVPRFFLLYLRVHTILSTPTSTQRLSFESHLISPRSNVCLILFLFFFSPYNTFSILSGHLPTPLAATLLCHAASNTFQASSLPSSLQCFHNRHYRGPGTVVIANTALLHLSFVLLKLLQSGCRSIGSSSLHFDATSVSGRHCLKSLKALSTIFAVSSSSSDSDRVCPNRGNPPKETDTRRSPSLAGSLCEPTLLKPFRSLNPVLALQGIISLLSRRIDGG